MDQLSNYFNPLNFKTFMAYGVLTPEKYQWQFAEELWKHWLYVAVVRTLWIMVPWFRKLRSQKQTITTLTKIRRLACFVYQWSSQKPTKVKICTVSWEKSMHDKKWNVIEIVKSIMHIRITTVITSLWNNGMMPYLSYDKCFKMVLNWDACKIKQTCLISV